MDVYVYVGVCLHVYCACVEARSQHPISFSIDIIWDRVSNWSWSLLICWIGWPLSPGIPPFMSPQHWDYWPMFPLHGSWSLISGPYTWTSSILPSKVFIQLWRQIRSKPEHKEKEVNKHFSKVMSLTTHFTFAWVFLGRCCWANETSGSHFIEASSWAPVEFPTC